MKFHLGHFLGLSAIVLAIAAAFFSVTGLGQLFAGASLAVIIMASALEFSKVIIATFLHKYWDDVSKMLRAYLTFGLVVLVCITSAGIYGFLSSAYQQTATSLEVHNNQIGLVDNKIGLVSNKIESNEKQINSKLARYDKLMDLRTVQEVRLDSMINRRYFSNANLTRDEIAKANTEMDKLQGEVDLIGTQNSQLQDSISKLQTEKLEMKSSSEVAAEVGPLEYMAELTDKPMDVIVNYFTLLLIFVFDPLAICLVIATSWVFERKEKVKKGSNKLYVKNAWTPVTEKEDTVKPSTTVDDGYNDLESYPEEDEMITNNTEEVKSEVKVEDTPSPKKTNKLSIDDIEKVGPYSSSDRGFSTKIPEPSTKEKLGSNKYLKDGKEVIYKRKSDNEEENK